MGVAVLNMRTDAEVKKQAEAIFTDLGLNMTTAVNMFLRAAIRERGLPFSVKISEPNDATRAALEEGKRIALDASVPSYDSVESLREALGV